MKFGFQGMILSLYKDGLREKFIAACKLRPPGCTAQDCTISAPGSRACDPYETLDFIEDSIWLNVVLLLVLCVVFRVISIVLINWITMDYVYRDE